MITTEREMRFKKPQAPQNITIKIEPYNRTATYEEVQDALWRVH